jgi:hypothetical protein
MQPSDPASSTVDGFFPRQRWLNTEKSTAISPRAKNAFHPAIPEAPTIFTPHGKSLVFSTQIVFANSRNKRTYANLWKKRETTAHRMEQEQTQGAEKIYP